MQEGQTFTFETVMSHPSKTDFMRKGRERGYRVYQYFVATDDPTFNIDRVHRRVLQGGHPVKDELVESRYHRSIALMTDACKDVPVLLDNVNNFAASRVTSGSSGSQ